MTQPISSNKRRGHDGTGFYIRTFTGKKFHWDTIESNEYGILDIAHALAMNCRWTGHVRHFYSVAQHCVYAAQEAPPQYKLAALLHDASEAYVHDTPSPLKWYLQDHDFTAFKDLEQRIDQAIAKTFDINWPRHPIIKEIDLRLLRTENRDLMPDGEERLHMAANAPYSWHVVEWGPKEAERKYLEMFDRIWSQP